MQGVGGAHTAGNKFKKLLSKFDFRKLSKLLISQVKISKIKILWLYNCFPKHENVSADLRLCALIHKDITTQGRLVMEAEKAAAYPASSVRFSFLKYLLFILKIFRIAVATSK